MQVLKIVEQEMPRNPVDDRLAAHREAETEIAFQAEFGDYFNAVQAGRQPKLKEATAANLSELLVTVAKARMEGKTVIPYNDPFSRMLGFIVDEDDTLHQIPLTGLSEQAPIPPDVAAMFHLGSKDVMDALRTEEGCNRLAGVSEETPEAIIEEGCRILVEKAVAENETWKPVDQGVIDIPRPSHKVA